MKTIHIIALSLAIYGHNSLANTDVAKAAFLNDPAVQSAMDEARRSFVVEQTPNALFLSESCGFAGCFTRYLVGISLKGGCINRQSSSIIAEVTVFNGREATEVSINSRCSAL